MIFTMSTSKNSDKHRSGFTVTFSIDDARLSLDKYEIYCCLPIQVAVCHLFKKTSFQCVSIRVGSIFLFEDIPL